MKHVKLLCATLAAVFAVAMISTTEPAFAADKDKSKETTKTTTTESPCKGLEKTKCEKNKSCVWIKGYTKEDKTKVAAYCRAKPKPDTTKKDEKKK